jgi:predicted nucleic-acid-binding protein
VIAIDTIVVVRFLVNDDHEQARRARALIEAEDLLVQTSVLLEAEWVLRTTYRFPRQLLFEALRAFLALPRIVAQDRQSADAALDWAERGMDFADALHLAGAAGCDAFASFDRALQRTAAKLGAPEVREP